MATKGNTPRLRLLVIVPLVAITLVCIQAEAQASSRALHFHQNDIQIKRFLREPPTTEDGTSDDRGIDITKLKDVTETGTSKLSSTVKELVESVKLKFMPDKQQFTEQLFTNLKVGQVEANVFKSDQFGIWASSVSKSYGADRDARNMAMVSTLTTQYGDEALSSMLAAAKEVQETKGFAINMLEGQMATWVAKNKPADDVFQFLKLDKAGDKLLESPMLMRWMEYVETVGKDDPYKLLFLQLAKRYDDEGLAKVIIGMDDSLLSKIDVSKLDELLLQRWVSTEKTVNDVYNLLKLQDLEPSKLLKSPALDGWLSYVMEVQKRRGGYRPYELLMEKLQDRYDGRMLIDFILAAKKALSTELHATELWKELPTYWQMHGKSADKVFKLLNLKNVDEDKLIESPMWRTWVAFLEKKNGRNSDEMMFLVLMKYYSKEGVKRLIDNAKKSTSTETIATKLQHELWHNEKKTADDVFNLLKLSYEGDAFLRSPELSTWFSYATYLHAIEGTAIRSTVIYKYGTIVELEEKFGYIELARKISEEMRRASNTVLKKNIGILQKQQFELWMSKLWSPNDVAVILKNTAHDERDTKLILDYLDFVQGKLRQN